jgi:tripartite-type tricarboxylate transporter receptor subunit TctC
MLRSIIAAFVCVFSAIPAGAQDVSKYPDRPVRVIVGFAAGSGPDLHARAIATQLGLDLGQSFVVENRLGANGTLATRSVVQSPPDGYTILFTSDGIASTPHIFKNLGYDILTDLRAVSTHGILDGLFVLVSAKSEIKSLQQLIAKAKSDRVLYGSPGVGNGLHLAAETFSKEAGIKMTHVPYKGASEVMNGMLSGSVDVMFVTPPSVIGLLQAGEVRALAFTGTKPFPAFPNVPLAKDIVPTLKPIGGWGVFMVPGKTPDALVDKLSQAIKTALKADKVAQLMARDGYVPDGRTPQQTQDFFKSKVETMAEAVKAANIEPQ